MDRGVSVGSNQRKNKRKALAVYMEARGVGVHIA